MPILSDFKPHIPIVYSIASCIFIIQNIIYSAIIFSISLWMDISVKDDFN